MDSYLSTSPDRPTTAVAEAPTDSGSDPLSPSVLAAPAPPGRRFRTFDALIDVPAFRWYLLSQVGTWSAMQMQQVVRGFLAYELTGSFAALGAVELGNSLPRVILALYGGVVADRASRRVIIQVGQAINTVLSGAPVSERRPG